MSAPTTDIRRAGQRFLTRGPGLESRHCFSFGSHYDPGNVGHGRLLVSNEERVSSGAGFDDHPHRDAEIVTWVLRGSLVHEDSFGHRGVVHRGLAQRMTAGRGIVHAERNDAFRLDPDLPAESVHYVQMWLRPDESGLPPSYQQGAVDLADLAADWVPLASGGHPDAAVTVAARGSTLWATTLASGRGRLLPSAPLVHLYVAAGAVHLEGAGDLAAGDSVRLVGETALRVVALAPAELLGWQLDS